MAKYKVTVEIEVDTETWNMPDTTNHRQVIEAVLTSISLGNLEPNEYRFVSLETVARSSHQTN